MLILTEKPSVAASFAQALNCSKTNGHYSSTDGSIIITNCIGHLFQLVPPDQYNPAFKKWNMADLPIVPHIFRYEVTAATKLQAQLVVDLIKKNTHNTIIIATDAGREGELIARITLQMAGITDISRCKRFWVSEALTPDVIQQGLQEAKPLADFNALADQAYARQHADWLIGINLSRYMSIGQQTVFSAGRVQTPLAMAVLFRDDAIKNFKSSPYIVYTAHIRDKTGNTITAQLLNPADDNSCMFPITDAISSEQFIGQKITSAEKNTQRKTQRPPQLYNITGLQKEAAKRFDYTPAKTLEIAQVLYEKHKCLSYPRTPSRVMGDNNVALFRDIYTSLAPLYPEFSTGCSTELINQNNKHVFNSAQLEDHHALIPLKNIPATASQEEKNIYELVLASFFMVIKEAYVFDLHQLILHCGENRFCASLRTVITQGWKIKANHNTDDTDEQKTDDNIQEIQSFDYTACSISDFVKQQKKTTPPKHYTMSSLLSFMEHPKETGKNNLCGLGTPATRAEIIKDLIDRGYLSISAKNVIATDKAAFLFKRLSQMPLLRPFISVSKTTDMEQQLKDNPQKFEEDVVTLLKAALVPVNTHSIEQFAAVSIGSCPMCGKPLYEGKSSWYCSGYKTHNCTFTIWKTTFGTTLSVDDVKALLSGKHTRCKICTSKNGKSFKASLFLQDGKVSLDFEKKK